VWEKNPDLRVKLKRRQRILHIGLIAWEINLPLIPSGLKDDLRFDAIISCSVSVIVIVNRLVVSSICGLIGLGGNRVLRALLVVDIFLPINCSKYVANSSGDGEAWELVLYLFELKFMVLQNFWGLLEYDSAQDDR